MTKNLDATPHRFKVDARALISLGRESIKDHTTALVELVKNAYDADADNVEIEIVCTDNPSTDYVRIADDGYGMTAEDIDRKWLRIGYSAKRVQKISPKGRRETGEKGIGRLSADRLGARLELRSKKSSSRPVGVAVDWDLFDVDETEISAVPVPDLGDPTPTVAVRKGAKRQIIGTEIIISRLRQKWTEEDITILRTELATLIPAGVSKQPFSIWLRSNGAEDFKKLESAFDGQAELLLTSKFDQKGNLTYSVTARPKAGVKTREIVKSGKIPWEQLVLSNTKKAYNLGPFEVRLSFFLRSSVSLNEGLSLSRLREYLDTEGGVKIYRDGVRVKPYGDPTHPEGDWLGLARRKTLNPAGAGRSDFRISANQLVGSVLISRDSNNTLTDSAAREGLIHSDGFSLLLAAVFGCVELLEGIYHERYVKKAEEGKSKDSGGVQMLLPNVVADLKTTLSEVTRNLETASLAPRGKASNSLLMGSVQKLEIAVERVQQAEREIEELASQNTIYRGLATVGISSAVFGHETESSLAQARLSTSTARKLLTLKTIRLVEAIDEIRKAEQAIGKVELWGQFALSRLKKDKRRRTRFDLSRVVTELVREVRPLFEAARIEVKEEVKSHLEIKAFQMDVESLVLNLLTNAYYAAISSSNNRKIVVVVSPKGSGASRNVILQISDSGPGIATENMPRIWEPLFTTKVDSKGRPTGTGLGLTVVKSVARDMGATVMALPKGSLGGATFEVQIPLFS